MLYSLIVICLTILLFTWMVRDSLCELHIRQENNELAASLAWIANSKSIWRGYFLCHSCGVMHSQGTLLILSCWRFIGPITHYVIGHFLT
ncbi:Hok/Gef family protein [Salmonella enterica subsp. enterica]|nr:Hok/Gef family protein [Salmonella enterica subsp. enterica serovar Geraldton]